MRSHFETVWEEISHFLPFPLSLTSSTSVTKGKKERRSSEQEEEEEGPLCATQRSPPSARPPPLFPANFSQILRKKSFFFYSTKRLRLNLSSCRRRHLWSSVVSVQRCFHAPSMPRPLCILEQGEAAAASRRDGKEDAALSLVHGSRTSE